MLCNPKCVFKSGICLLIAPVPVHCFSITFNNMTIDELNGTHILGTIVTLLDDHITHLEEAVMSLEICQLSLEIKGIEFDSIITSMLVNRCQKVYACLNIEQLLNMHNRYFSETLLENDKTMYVWVEMTWACC